MRKNLPVTGRNLELPEGTHLLSTTDIHSCITYVNPNFVQMSGFTTQELIGQPHSIVRHPDMPEAVFAQMWKTLKSGRPWMGMIKNRCKNGDHFWASAYATPIYQNGKIIEYQALLMPAEAKQVKAAEKRYRQLRKSHNVNQADLSFGIKAKLSLCFLLIWLFSMLFAYGTDQADISSLVVVEGISCLLCMAATNWQLSSIRRLANQAKQLADNPLSQYLYSGRHDELGQIDLALRMAQFDTSVLLASMHSAELQADSGVEELLQAIAYFRGLQADSNSIEHRQFEL